MIGLSVFSILLIDPYKYDSSQCFQDGIGGEAEP